MIRYIMLAAGVALAASANATVAKADTAACPIDRPVVFGGLGWDSNDFHTAVATKIIDAGFGCEVEKIPGETIPLYNALGRGDVDIVMEVWLENVLEQWNELEKTGQVQTVGVNFPDAVQGWFVPKFLVEGPDAPAPDLKSVADLPKYKDLFEDQEEPGMGRFYNCIAGWGCEVINSKKLVAYDLEDSFTNFRPGTGAALSSAIEAAMKREKPIVFYYWGPTWVLGKYGDDLMMLEEPAYDVEVWDRMSNEENPTEATAYPLVEVLVGANTEFADAAPELISFLDAYQTDNSTVSKALAFMQDTGGTAEDAAADFLKNNEGVWTAWVPDDVAERVKSSL